MESFSLKENSTHKIKSPVHNLSHTGHGLKFKTLTTSQGII